MSTVSGAALIGRAEELERLRECCREAAGGAGSLVLIDGEAGAGKTRLLEEVMKAPLLPGGCVAFCAGALDYARAPYAPIRDLLVALDKRFPKVLRADAALAAALRPVLDFKPAGDAAAGEGDRRRILDAVVSAFEKYAASAPILLAVEDVHWLDGASSDVLLHLTRRIAHLPAFVIVSFRPVEAQEDAQIRHLVAQLSRSASLTFSLKPLSPADALLLIDDVAGGDVPMNARRRIAEMADGNPLLLVEYAKLARKSPDALEGGLPITLKAIVAERLASFDAVDVEVLRVAAELGEFGAAILSEIAQIDMGRVLRTLKAARRASIVHERPSPPETFTFTHALIRRAITDDMLAVERRELNARIAARLELDAAAGGAASSRLAHHCRLAGLVRKARLYSEDAAQEAMSIFAYADAVEFFERAVDARALTEETYDLHRRLADAYNLAQRVSEAVELTALLYEFALARGAYDDAAAHAFELSRRRYQILDDEGSIQTARAALERLEQHAHPRAVFDLYAVLAWYLGSLRRVEQAREALAQAERLRDFADDEALARYYEARAFVKVYGGHARAYRDDIEKALALAPPAGLLRALDNAIGLAAASTLEDTEFVLELCERVEALARTLPESRTARSVIMTAWPFFLAGELERARRALQPALAYAEDSPMVAFVLAKTGIPLALHLEDDLLLRRCARPRLLESAFASQTPNVFGPVAAAVAMQLREEKRASEAATLLEQAVKRLPDAANNVPLIIEVARANVSRALPRCMEMLEQLADESRSIGGARHLCAAYAARGGRRRESALAAADLFESVRWMLYAAEAYELAGESDRALEIYRRCGSKSGVRRIEGRTSVRTQSVLSKREWEVAGLVAEGKSNRAIADELVLSERTIENHIASIFGKLHLRSRAEIAAYVARSAAGQP